jgi:hypothetical protein
MESLETTSALKRAGLAAGKYLHVALALTALIAISAAPAVATTYRHHHYRTATFARPLHMYAGEAFVGDVPEGTSIDMRRAAAVHDCSVLAAKFSNSSWETAQLANYGACMTEHGQIP